MVFECEHSCSDDRQAQCYRGTPIANRGIQELIKRSKVGVWLDEVIMEASALAQSASDRYSQVASPIHTILVLAALGGWAIWHKIFADQLSAAANPNRVRFYVVTLFYEWLLFVLVVAGVRRSGASVLIVLGDHWHSVRQVLRDIGIAAGFWIVTWMLLWVFGWLLRIAALGRNVSMLPHARYRTDIMDSALSYRRYLRGDDLSRLPATAVHGPD